MHLAYTIFCKTRRLSENEAEMGKMLRKPEGSISNIQCFCWSKIITYPIITFTMLNIDFKFEHTRLAKRGYPILAGIILSRRKF